MDVTYSKLDAPKIRLLAVIASYGTKNIEFLRRIIRKYQLMAMDVDVVVVSEGPKDLGAGVKVVVGLPTRNPMSLPFAHKAIFAENADRYDLFVYSEDDIDVSERHIRAFMRVTAELESEEVAGFIRYEIDEQGVRHLPDVHGWYSWNPHSVRRRGRYTIAKFTNDHAGFYVLTQAHLRKALSSGGFLQTPYKERYGMLETAATDPYTRCGFRKVICVSAIEEFLVHHLPNRYVSELGIPLPVFEEQIQTLMAIGDGAHPAITLFELEPKILPGNFWSTNYYEKPCAELLRMVPNEAETILSVGCGWGATEVELQRRGATVTALPLNSVVGAGAARMGINLIYGTFEQSLSILQGRKFDCVLMKHLLHLLPSPWRVVDACSEFLEEGGQFVVTEVNCNYLPVLIRRVLGLGDYRNLRNFGHSGINPIGSHTMRRRLSRIGFHVAGVRWFNQRPVANLATMHRWLPQFLQDSWIIKARMISPRSVLRPRRTADTSA